MVNEIELYVCDEDGLILLGDDEGHVCMQCEKPMVLARFERKLVQPAVDASPCTRNHKQLSELGFDICPECKLVTAPHQ